MSHRPETLILILFFGGFYWFLFVHRHVLISWKVKSFAWFDIWIWWDFSTLHLLVEKKRGLEIVRYLLLKVQKSIFLFSDILLALMRRAIDLSHAIKSAATNSWVHSRNHAACALAMQNRTLFSFPCYFLVVFTFMHFN